MDLDDTFSPSVAILAMQENRTAVTQATGTLNSSKRIQKNRMHQTLPLDLANDVYMLYGLCFKSQTKKLDFALTSNLI